MFKLPKNKPEDVEFIKKAHEDPNWPEDLDKPEDWDKVSLPRKIWFVVGDAVKTIIAVIVMVALPTSCAVYFFDEESWFEEPYCEQTSRGCVEP